MAPKLILIPGLGVGKRLFDPQRRQFAETMFVPDWQRPIRMDVDGKARWESLSDYASRWADRWSQTVLATPEARESFFIGGCSFGGMVAIEAARHLQTQDLQPRGVVLMASARSPAGAKRRLNAFGALLARLLPEPIVRSMLRLTASWAIKREKLSELDQVMMRKLIESIDMELVRFGLDAMAHWKLDDEELDQLREGGVKIHQIHGSRDPVLMPARGHRATLVDGAGHLVNVSHAAQVNAWLEEILESAGA